MAKGYAWNTGRMGYGKHLNPESNGGGIQPERMQEKPDPNTFLVNLKEEILDLIASGHENQAFKLLCKCPVSERRKLCFCEKHFPAWQ